MSSTKTEPRDKMGRSRRKFLSAAAGAAAGAVGGALLFPDNVTAQTRKAGPAAAAPSAQAAVPGIQLSEDFAKSLAAPVKRADFSGEGITGRDVFANLCQDEGLAALFTAPGNYAMINSFAQVGIPSYGGRHEGSMASAADGFYRVTGEVTACSGQDGPGFCAMVMNIAQAHMANTPLLVMAANKAISTEDNFRGRQFMYQQPVTESIRKYGKRILSPNRVYEYGAYAFRNLKTGVPGVVHIDFVQEVQSTRFKDPSQLVGYCSKEQYRSESVPAPAAKDVAQAINMINRAERPLIFAGHGVFHRKAWDPLMKAAEKNEVAVVVTGPMSGQFPDDHRLSASAQNSAMMSADLIVFIGQYSMPNPGEFTVAPGVPTIRVHPEVIELGRNWPLNLGIVSDERLFLEALADGMPAKKRDAWVAELAASKQKFEEQNAEYYALGLKHSRATNVVHPAVIAKEVHDFLYKGTIDPKQTVTGFGGHTMSSYSGRWLRANRPGQRVTCYYQFGAMGPDMAMMMGAAVAVQRGIGPQAAYKGAPVVVLTGDAGVGYSIMECDTLAKYKIPLITIVYNNDAWGTYDNTLANSPRATHMYLMQENLRYDQVAQGLGVRGEYVRTPEEFKAALKRSYDAAAKDSVPTLINVQGKKEFSEAKRYPPGVAYLPDPGIGTHAH